RSGAAGHPDGALGLRAGRLPVPAADHRPHQGEPLLTDLEARGGGAGGDREALRGQEAPDPRALDRLRAGGARELLAGDGDAPRAHRDLAGGPPTRGPPTGQTPPTGAALRPPSAT